LALEIVEKSRGNSSLALEFFENMNEPMLVVALTISAWHVCTAGTLSLTPSKLVGCPTPTFFCIGRRRDEGACRAAQAARGRRHDASLPKGFAVQPHTGARVGAQRSGRAGHFSVATHVHVLGSRASAWRQNASRKVVAKRNAKALKFEL
jgi:hypothetical protein